jgi:predicted nucleotidyltransferase
MERERLLREIRARLEEAHGERLAGVVLYGSEARGEACEDSDIDLLVLLRGPVRYLADLRRSIEAIYPPGSRDRVPDPPRSRGRRGLRGRGVPALPGGQG